MSASNEKQQASHGFGMSTEATFTMPQTKQGNVSIRNTGDNSSIPPGYNFDEKKKSKKNEPLGKVVESGQEHIGRWTKEEHDAFLEALQEYGKEWKKVAAKVKTRTVVQTRTHAQKYFQKIQKGFTDDKDIGVVEMGTVLEAKKASTSTSAKKV